jgi:hypothetical protein
MGTDTPRHGVTADLRGSGYNPAKFLSDRKRSRTEVTSGGPCVGNEDAR